IISGIARGSVSIPFRLSFGRVLRAHKAAFDPHLALLVDADDRTSDGKLLGGPDAVAILDLAYEFFELAETLRRLVFAGIVPCVTGPVILVLEFLKTLLFPFGERNRFGVDALVFGALLVPKVRADVNPFPAFGPGGRGFLFEA